MTLLSNEEILSDAVPGLTITNKRVIAKKKDRQDSMLISEVSSAHVKYVSNTGLLYGGIIAALVGAIVPFAFPRGNPTGLMISLIAFGALLIAGYFIGRHNDLVFVGRGTGKLQVKVPSSAMSAAQDVVGIVERVKIES